MSAPSRERRVLTRLLRWSLMSAVVAQMAISFLASTPSRADEAQLVNGRDLYVVNCSSCHGLAGGGTSQAPTLRGVGAASVDFQLSTGRMPLGDPSQQPTRQQPKFSSEEIDAIVAYVDSFQAGGPAIPTVDVSQGQLPAGMRLFLSTCASCHGSGATGDSVGGGQIAPSLYQATPTQIGEAIRTGPGLMPKFGPETVTEQQVNSIAAYLLSLRTDETNAGPGGAQLGRVGAVAEGFIALVVGLGLLSIVLYLTGSRS